MIINGELVASLEDGFTQVPNPFKIAINRSKLSGIQIRICNHIIQRTYGWHRKTAVISHQEFAEECGTYRQRIGRELQKLIDYNVVLCFDKAAFRTSAYMMNHTISKWDPRILPKDTLDYLYSHYSKSPKDNQPDAQTDVKGEGSCSSITLSIAPRAHPYMHEGVSDNITPHAHPAVHERAYQNMHGYASSALEDSALQPPLKKDLNKYSNKLKKYYDEDEKEYLLAKLLYESVRMNYPEFKVYDLKNWCDVMHKMIRYDKINPKTIEQAIYYARQDEYFLEHILRPEEFRGRFNWIYAAMRRDEKRKAEIASTYGSRSYIEKDEDPKEDKYAFFFERK